MTQLPKLGIFGDSFGDPNHLNSQLYWVDILKEKYIVDNYSVSGSSIYYSYVKFKENHKKYDKIVFLVTGANRIWTRHIYDDLASIEQTQLSHITDGTLLNQHCDNLSKFYPEQKLIIKTFESAINYYTYLQNYELDIFTAAGLIYEIKNLRPDVLMISALPSWDKNNIHPDYLSSIIGHKHFLIEITFLEHNAMGFNGWEDFVKYIDKKSLNDIRHCHLTNENNIILGNKMLQWIENNQVTLNLEDFVVPTSFNKFKKTHLIKK